jgi:signal transduction histidine kinase
MLVENLLSNASKYTPNGGKIGLELTAEPNAPIVIKVADNGVGIPPEDIDKLFQKFSRIENELSTERGGSGIGLYLVKRIADLHHGSVDVVSKAGEGTIFTVTMPREQPK